jgi:hypothetical protein
MIMCHKLDVGSRMEPPNNRARTSGDLSQLEPRCGQANKIGTESDFMTFPKFQLFQ